MVTKMVTRLHMIRCQEIIPASSENNHFSQRSQKGFMEKMRPELGVQGWSIWIGGEKGEGTSSETSQSSRAE